MPSTIVSSRLIFSRSATRRRAISPTIKPHNIQVRIVPRVICILLFWSEGLARIVVMAKTSDLSLAADVLQASFPQVPFGIDFVPAGDDAFEFFFVARLVGELIFQFHLE